MKNPRRSEDIVERRILGRTLLVPVRGSIAEMQELYMPNETAEFIWGLLDGERTVDDIAAMVADEFDAPVEEAASDAREFLGWLLEHGLAREANDS